jgi:hypothetical protein
MRLFSIALLIICLFASCNMNNGAGAQPPQGAEKALKDSANFTSIQWLDSTFKDFGKISEGQKLEVSFAFKNTGNKPLIIAKVQPSCGCTIAEQPNEPVAPGATGTIRASFNSEGRVGPNHKTLFVFANTKNSQEQQLQFVVEVEKKKW